MYTITETKTVPNYDTIMYRVKIAVDTAEEIPTPLDEWAVGSEMEVYENGGSRYKLGTDREWYPVNFKKGSGGGDNSEVADQVNQNTSSISLLTGRVSRIETNIGGHTVKSDVPENAVFTDTVYDDSEVKTDILLVKEYLSELEALTTIERITPQYIVENMGGGYFHICKIGTGKSLYHITLHLSGAYVTMSKNYVMSIDSIKSASTSEFNGILNCLSGYIEAKSPTGDNRVVIPTTATFQYGSLIVMLPNGEPIENVYNVTVSGIVLAEPVEAN